MNEAFQKACHLRDHYAVNMFQEQGLFNIFER
jgi:hypothetical protein